MDVLQAVREGNHEPVMVNGQFRGFRHSAYRHDLPSEMIIKQGGAAIIKANGEPLVAGDCFPERLDIAVDQAGNVIRQEEFERRYVDMIMAQGDGAKEPAFEPRPTALQYIMHAPDPGHYDEVGFYVPPGFDPLKDHGKPMPGNMAPDGTTIDEWVSQGNPVMQVSASADPIKAKLETLSELHQDGVITSDQLAEKINAILGGAAIVEPPAPEEPAIDETAVPAWERDVASGDEIVLAPCGEEKPANTVKQHINFCKRDACVEVKAQRKSKEN